MATTSQVRAKSLTRRRDAAPILDRAIDWAATAALAVGAVFMALPFVWMFSTSLRPVGESFTLPPAWLPTEWHVENYAAVFQSSVPFLMFGVNSLKVTFFVTLGQLISCSMAGFAFARLRFPGRNILFILLLASLMVPGQVTIIPVFIIMRQLGLVDSHLALILPGLTSAFGVFLLRQYFLTLPQDLLDAARIDGAGPWTSFWRVALPLAGPSLAALAIITFNNTWNSYFTPLIFINTWEKMTLPLGITALRGYLSAGSPAVVMAAVTMTIAPVLLVFLVAQRWFIEGITQSGIKG
ncbi:MAG: L-arabinose transporter permease [Chloroflexota bacterium]|jgi:multiple sugar transport system permease protein